MARAPRPRVAKDGKGAGGADPAFLDSTAAADKGGKSLLKAFTDNIGVCIDNKLSKLEQGYEIKALIWHQGESDNKVGQKYHKNLKDVIAYIRKYLVEKTGGHLASTIATHAAKACRPDFQILFYPVITFVGKTHGGSRRHLLGKEADNEALCREYSNELHVKRGDTPPAVVILAKNDMAVPPASNGVAYYNALKAAGIPATLIEYDEGGHGFGFKKSFMYHDQLLHDLGEWLK